MNYDKQMRGDDGLPVLRDTDRGAEWSSTADLAIFPETPEEMHVLLGHQADHPASYEYTHTTFRERDAFGIRSLTAPLFWKGWREEPHPRIFYDHGGLPAWRRRRRMS